MMLGPPGRIARRGLEKQVPNMRNLSRPDDFVRSGGAERLRLGWGAVTPVVLTRLVSPAVGVERPDSKRFTRPEFRLEFSYPAATPQGQAVERNEEPFRHYPRIHLSSEATGLTGPPVRKPRSGPYDPFCRLRCLGCP